MPNRLQFDKRAHASFRSHVAQVLRLAQSPCRSGSITLAVGNVQARQLSFEECLALIAVARLAQDGIIFGLEVYFGGGGAFDSG